MYDMIMQPGQGFHSISISFKSKFGYIIYEEFTLAVTSPTQPLASTLPILRSLTSSKTTQIRGEGSENREEYRSRAVSPELYALQDRLLRADGFLAGKKQKNQAERSNKNLENLENLEEVWKEILHKDLLKALDPDVDLFSFTRLLKHIYPSVYMMPILTKPFCDLLKNELTHAYSLQNELGLSTPSAPNGPGVMLAELGLGPLLDALGRKVLQPLSRRFFADWGGAVLDDSVCIFPAKSILNPHTHTHIYIHTLHACSIFILYMYVCVCVNKWKYDIYDIYI